MMLVELKPLFKRLNASCTAALEAAAGTALARGHYEIGVEHLLRRLLDAPGNDLDGILKHFDVDTLRLTAQLDETLAATKNGNPGRPVFSPFLTEWVQDAWLSASITLGAKRIRSAALLHALLVRPTHYGAGGSWLESLKVIGVETLIKQMETAIAGSAEAEPDADASTANGSHPLTPGAANSGAIERFCEDFTAKAAAGKIDPVFGRDSEIRQMIDILARRRKNNPICVGDPGVGKTAVVEGLALRIIEGDVPEFLRGTRLVGLDLGLLEAGASVKGEFENRLRGVIDEIKSSPQPTILFIDEAHMLIGAGGTAGGTDAANLLKPALARGELRTIAATTWKEYKKYFEKDPALARRFQLVKLDAPDVATTITILRGLKSKYEQSHGVHVQDEAIRAAAELSDRYITGRLLPDKAVDLLDTAVARVRISQGIKPAELERVERQLAALEREQQALQRDLAHGHASVPERQQEISNERADLEIRRGELETRWQRERELAQTVLALRAETAENDRPANLDEALAQLRELQQDAPMLFTDVSPDAIAQVVSDWTGVPLGKMRRESARAIFNLADDIKSRIKGQDHAVEQIASALRVAQAGLRDPIQPMGVFLLVGPSGVGKTETAGTIADALFGGEQAMTVLNMSEFQEKHTLSRLVGSPPGYVGYGEGGVLTEAVRRRPYSVVLLDEVEKANLDIVNLFYQVFDKGMLADGEGRLIDFSNTVIFLTSNLATQEITEFCANAETIDVPALVEHIRPQLSRHFKPALLARMTVIPYLTLDEEALQTITRQKLEQISQRLQASNRIRVRYADDVYATIAARCTEVDSGARNIDMILRKSLLPALSDAILQGMTEGTGAREFHIGLDDDSQWVIDSGELRE